MKINDYSLKSKKAIILVNPLSSTSDFRNYVKEMGLLVISVYTQSKSVFKNRMGQNLDWLYSQDDYSIHADNLEKCIKEINGLSINTLAVIPCHECGVRRAALIAQKLKLNHNSVDVAQICRDKHDMRKKVSSLNLNNPHFKKCRTLRDAQQFAAINSFPIVAKTPTGGGTSNVYVCRDIISLEKAFKKIMTTMDLFGNIPEFTLLEDYLLGEEFIIDTFTHDEVTEVVGIWQYEKINNDYADNLYYKIIGKSVDDPIYLKAKHYVMQLIEGIGIKHGLSHVELKLEGDEPALVEIGARLPGWGIPELYRDATNFDPWKETIQSYLDKTCTKSIKHNKFMAMALVPYEKSSGEITRILGMDKITKLPSYVTHSIKVTEGDYISPSKELYDIPLEVCLAHESEETLNKDLDTIHSSFGFELHQFEPELELLA